jgi:hypothetical protein
MLSGLIRLPQCRISRSSVAKNPTSKQAEHHRVGKISRTPLLMTRQFSCSRNICTQGRMNGLHQSTKRTSQKRQAKPSVRNDEQTSLLVFTWQESCRSAAVQCHIPSSISNGI